MNRWYRSRSDRKITGLCGGLADTLNMDSTILRLIVVAATIFTGGAVIPFYLLAVLVVPSEPWNGGPFDPAYGHGYGPEPEHGYRGGCAGPWGERHGNWRDWRRAEKHYRKAQKYGWAPPQEQDRYEAGYKQAAAPGAAGASDLDDMMKDIEKKAMWKEIEELRSKVAQYEKQQNQSKGDV